MRWPKTEDAPHCADGALDIGAVARFPPVATGQVDRLGMYRQLDINLREPRSQLLYEIAMPLEPAHDLGLGPNGHRRILS